MRLDSDGRLHSRAVISAAGVGPYLGREVPRWREHKLDPRRFYRLLRPAAELKASEGAWCVPLFDRHPEPDQLHEPNVIGYVRDCAFDGASGRLIGSVVVTSSDACRRIRTGECGRGLSAGYHYRPTMVRGKGFDMVMRDIQPHHVAIVSLPRTDGCWL